MSTLSPTFQKNKIKTKQMCFFSCHGCSMARCSFLCCLCCVILGMLLCSFETDSGSFSRVSNFCCWCPNYNGPITTAQYRVPTFCTYLLITSSQSSIRLSPHASCQYWNLNRLWISVINKILWILVLPPLLLPVYLLKLSSYYEDPWSHSVWPSR